MASYAADIRIGVTGKAQLNSLEKQLNRVNSQVNKLNKALTLRARVQAIRLDTRAATTAVKNLEDRINRLGRTITINLRTRDKDQGKSSGGGGNVAVVNQAPASTAQSVAKTSIINEQLRAQVALTDEEQKTLDVENKRLEAIKKLVDNIAKQEESQKRLNKALDQQRRLQASTNNRVSSGIFGKGVTREEGLKRINREINAAQRSLNNLQQIQVRFKNDVVDTSRAWRGVQAEIKKAGAATAEAARKQERFRKGRQAAIRGATAAGALIPGLSPLALGAAAGSKFGPMGAAIGAVAAALVSASVGFAKYGAAAAEAAAEQERFNLALRGITSGTQYFDALDSIVELSGDFNQSQGEVTKNFTKVQAAASSAGLELKDTEKVMRGLMSANTALGGNAESLRGILLATTQVLSKGKVQAEELRGQIGERLPGAFGLFAKSLGISTKELDKRMEQGKVSVEDFVTFTEYLLKRFGEDAEKILNSDALAGDRLKTNLDNLKRSVGTLLGPIGAAFQNTFGAIAKAITIATNALINFLGIGTAGAIAKAKGLIEGAEATLAGFGDTEREDLSARDKARYDRARQTLAVNKALLKDLEGRAELEAKLEELDTNTDKGSKPRDITKRLQAELALTDALLAGEKERVALSGLQQENALYARRQSQLAIQLERDKKLVATENITEASKQLKLKLLEKQYSLDLLQLEKDRQQLNYDRTRAFENEIAGLQTELDLSRALTDQQRVRIENDAAIAAIKRRDDLTPERMQKLISLQKQFNAERLANANPLNGYVKGLNSELQDTQQMLVEVAQTVEGSLTNAFSDVFTGLVEGTQSAQQVLLNFFKSIGDAFIQMATEIIAKQLVMISLQSILKALGGASGGSSDSYDPVADLNAGALQYGGGLAKGGPTKPDTAYTVGEKGPELFIPGTSGRVVPNDKMGGDVNSVININISDDGTTTDAEQASELGRMVEASVMGVITRERRPGGILSR